MVFIECIENILDLSMSLQPQLGQYGQIIHNKYYYFHPTLKQYVIYLEPNSTDKDTDKDVHFFLYVYDIQLKSDKWRLSSQSKHLINYAPVATFRNLATLASLLIGLLIGAAMSYALWITTTSMLLYIAAIAAGLIVFIVICLLILTIFRHFFKITTHDKILSFIFSIGATAATFFIPPLHILYLIVGTAICATYPLIGSVLIAIIIFLLLLLACYLLLTYLNDKVQPVIRVPENIINDKTKRANYLDFYKKYDNDNQQIKLKKIEENQLDWDSYFADYQENGHHDDLIMAIVLQNIETQYLEFSKNKLNITQDDLKYFFLNKIDKSVIQATLRDIIGFDKVTDEKINQIIESAHTIKLRKILETVNTTQNKTVVPKSEDFQQSEDFQRQLNFNQEHFKIEKENKKYTQLDPKNINGKKSIKKTNRELALNYRKKVAEKIKTENMSTNDYFKSCEEEAKKFQPAPKLPLLATNQSTDLIQKKGNIPILKKQTYNCNAAKQDDNSTNNQIKTVSFSSEVSEVTSEVTEVAKVNLLNFNFNNEFDDNYSMSRKNIITKKALRPPGITPQTFFSAGADEEIMVPKDNKLILLHESDDKIKNSGDNF